MTNLGKEVLHR